MRQRRETHKLMKMYDIIHDHTPLYLKSLLPRNSDASSYRTRGASAGNYIPYKCKTEQFRKSFFPSSINLFYLLPACDRNTGTRNSFRSKLKRSMKLPTPAYYYLGPRKANIILAQMRLQFSNLNVQLFNRGCIGSSMCQCGHTNETLQHYFLHCDQYSLLRHQLIFPVKNVLPPDVTFTYNILLFGLPQEYVNPTINMNISNATCNFILNSQRF